MFFVTLCKSKLYTVCVSSLCSPENPLPGSITELLEHYKLSDEQLDQECCDQHLARLARSGKFLWREWAWQFGLSDQQINDIEVDVSLDGVGKAQKALNNWHDLLGFTATYRKLVEIFLEAENAVLAGEACELLNGTKQTIFLVATCTSLFTYHKPRISIISFELLLYYVLLL